MAKERQKELMNEIYAFFNCRSLDDWYFLPYSRIHDLSFLPLPVSSINTPPLITPLLITPVPIMTLLLMMTLR